MLNKKSENLLILWTTDNKDTALHMVFMYAENAKINGWWKDITLLIWGASSNLVTRDKDIQNYIDILHKSGVRIIACQQCAENLNVVEILKKHKIEVFYTGRFLSDWLKSDLKILTI